MNAVRIRKDSSKVAHRQRRLMRRCVHSPIQYRSFLSSTVLQAGMHVRTHMFVHARARRKRTRDHSHEYTCTTQATCTRRHTHTHRHHRESLHFRARLLQENQVYSAEEKRALAMCATRYVGMH